MLGRNIRLYIRGKNYKQLKSAELSNWTGKAFIGKRHHTKIISQMEEVHVPGVYFLLNKSQEQIKQSLYIGEADDVAKRLKEHQSNGAWWEEFIVFISKDANLNKAHVRYLEKRLYGIASKNYALIDMENVNNPTGSKLPECDIDEMEAFLDNMLFMIKQLQLFNMTEIPNTDTIEDKESMKEDNMIFEMKLTKDRRNEQGEVLKAYLKPLEDGNYLLLKGSYIESEHRESFLTHNYYKLRKELEDKGLFQNSSFEGVLITKEDIPFSSSSAAAAIVKCRAVRGPKEWKTNDGRALDDYENRN